MTHDDSTVQVGRWARDGDGLPTYELLLELPALTQTPEGRPYPLEADPRFLLGNPELTLFVHGSGRHLLMSGERGWVRLNDVPGGHTAVLEVAHEGTTSSTELVGLGSATADPARARRIFGCGSAVVTTCVDDGVRVTRTVSVPPGDGTTRAVGAYVVDVAVVNAGGRPAEVRYTESLAHAPRLAVNREQAKGARPVRFLTSVTTAADGRSAVAGSMPVCEDPGILAPPEEPNRYNLYPPSVATVLLAGDLDTVLVEGPAEEGRAEIGIEARGTLAPGETATASFVVGLLPHGATAEGLLAWCGSLLGPGPGPRFGQAWADSLARFDEVSDEELRDELRWDGHALLAMATRSEYHGHTFVPQGMTYDYQMEMVAAPRDHLQHALATMWFAPWLARESILYTLCKMTYQGEIKYQDFGHGETSNSAWNTSDQQLYLFQTLGEYLRVTRDTSILEARTPYLPREAAFEGTTLEKVGRAFRYLRDEVSTGQHGLVRLMNSDWSDMVYVDASVPRFFHGAESQMNTAMAMAVLPPLVEQLDEYGAKQGDDVRRRTARLTTSMRLYVDRVSAAMLADMEGRTYATRVYLDAATPMGHDSMHLEPQAFLLQAPQFPADRKVALWDALRARLLDGEVLGPRQREVPVVGGHMVPGASENGGFWYALAGQTALGVATVDVRAADELVRRMTFRSFAAAYPAYWVGHWSAPDTVNSEFCGDIAGLPRPDDSGMWSVHAGYCAHAHAWPIHCTFVVAETAGHPASTVV